MTRKQLICRQRLRTLPSQFSWLDQRLVRDGYIDRCDHKALALYLFLVTVADAQGLSYYADATVSKRLSLQQASLQRARQSLIEAQLIAYQAPLYQVLALDGARSSVPEQQSASVPRTQTNRPMALAELLKLTPANTPEPQQAHGDPHDQL